eukprot:scaffold82500_cov31-Phaeocystis_antarctica.AAC.1
MKLKSSSGVSGCPRGPNRLNTWPKSVPIFVQKVRFPLEVTCPIPPGRAAHHEVVMQCTHLRIEGSPEQQVIVTEACKRAASVSLHLNGSIPGM